MALNRVNEIIKANIYKFEQEIQSEVTDLIINQKENKDFENFTTFSKKLKLSQLEEEILLILFAPEIDSKYNKIYAYLNGDLNKPYPTIELLITILSNSFEEKEFLYTYFTMNKSKINILSLVNFIPNNSYEPLFQQAVKLSSALRDYILGDNHLSRSLKSYSTILEPIEQKTPLEFKVLESKQYIINIYGRSKEQNKNKAWEIASKLNFGILYVDISEALKQEKDINRLISSLVRDAILTGTLIYFENFDSFFENEILLIEEKLLTKLEELTWITLISTKIKWTANKLPEDFELIYIKEKITNISNKLKNSSLNKYSKHIESSNNMNDIILPKKQKEQLSQIISHFKHHEKVFTQWEFKKFFQSTGLTLLFSGSSGTGKTMAASILAKELNLELFKIDLSNMVSKYVGETEKNLAELFQIAQESNIILFFDEADAIFGKRSTIKESSDKYSNNETSYLLQKIEEYEGIVILASNFKENIDDAFIRRFRFIVEFPTPNAKQRELIWGKVLTKEYLEENISFEELAKQFKLSGANIRNIALYAAFYASEENTKIKKGHIIKAIKIELDKVNIVVEDNEFKGFLEK